MAFSAGVYTLPTSALVSGQTVSASENNTVRNDMAASFNLTWLRNGTAAATANIPMGSFKLTGLGAATTSGDALSYGNAAVVTTLTSTSLTATRVPYAGTGGLLQDASTFTFDGTTLTAGGFSGPHNGTVGATTPNTGAFTTLSASSTVSGTGFSNYLASPPAIGGTAAAAGSFTTLTTSSTVTVNGGTANGVAYLNGSKVLTTGSALVFDGSNLGLGVTPSAWSSLKAFQINAQCSLSADGTSTQLSTNAYYGSGGWTYIGNNYATNYYQTGGQHVWRTAPSGTAGNAITFTQAMTLDASGNLGIGTSSPSSRLHTVTSSGENKLIVEATAASQSAVTSLITNASTPGQCILYMGKNGASTNGQVGYDPNNNFLYLYTNNTERMRIDSSGNVGIGTSSPSYRLSAVTAGTGTTVNSNNVASFYSNGNGYDACIRFGDGTNAATQIGYLSGNQYFATGGSERMRIDSSGNLLVNGTTQALSGSGYADCYVSTTAGANRNGFSVYLPTAGYAGYMSKGNTSSSTYFHSVMLNASDTKVGDITVSNTGTTFTTSSDYRLKENIQPMQNALATVAQLNPVTYTWKADGSDGQGFIAHELQAVVPDCVTGEKDAVDADGNPVYQGIDTSFLVATLTAAIKELKAELDATKAEVAALKGV